MMPLLFQKRRTAPAPVPAPIPTDDKDSSSDGDATTTTTAASTPFDYVHPSPKVLLHDSVVPTSQAGQVQYLTYHSNRAVRTSSNQETAIKVTYTQSGDAFPLQITHSTVGHSQQQHRLLVRDMNNGGKPCAVILQNTSSYRIYGLTPLSPIPAQQQPSTSLRQDDGHPLYLWGTVALAPGETTRRPRRREAPVATQYTLGMVCGPQYRADRVTTKKLGQLRKLASFDVKVSAPTHSTVNYPVGAHIQQLPSGAGWSLAVGPGLDPSLLLCFAAILDEIVCGTALS